MQLTLQSFSTMVENMSAAAQASCASLTDLAAGSVLRALLEASASVGLWLQYLILQVVSMTRLATSSGADVDSWVGDFGLVRLPGVAATGSATFACFAPNAQSATVPVGAMILTGDGTMSFLVVADPTNAAWVPASGAYVREAGTASITVPVEAATPGIVGNVQAGTVNLLAQSIGGIDTVTNLLPFSNGLDAEPDNSLKARFADYINTRSRATAAAIGTAIAGVAQGLTWTIEENTDASGATRPGFFTVVVDDGTGAPAAALLASVSTAVDLVRPVGTGFAVIGPDVVTTSISLTVGISPSADPAAVRANVGAAIAAFVDALSVGAALPYSRVSAVAYGADPGVTNVLAVTVNGGTSDLGGGVGQAVRLGAVTVS